MIVIYALSTPPVVSLRCSDVFDLDEITHVKGGKKNARQAFFVFFIIKTLKLGLRKPYTHNVRVSKMASHPHHPSEVVPSFEKRKNKRERKRERQREREFVATYLLVCIILKVAYV